MGQYVIRFIPNPVVFDHGESNAASPTRSTLQFRWWRWCSWNAGVYLPWCKSGERIGPHLLLAALGIQTAAGDLRERCDRGGVALLSDRFAAEALQKNNQRGLFFGIEAQGE